MEKFNFKFERVLGYKKTIEELKKAEYGQAKKILNTEEEKLKKLLIEKSRISLEKNNINDNTKINVLINYNNYLEKVNLLIKNQKINLEEAEYNAEKSRINMVEASRDKKIFEKLKRKYYNEFLNGLKKEEEKINDQLVTYRNSLQ